ncbi:MAG TPA: YbhN family protein [Acidimicrobiales bacterium]|nr:YbhN family protein [Acidimicrobiales bacterium]
METSLLHPRRGRQHAGQRRRRLRFTGELLVLGGLGGLAWLEHHAIGRTVAVLPRADWRWLLAAAGLELVSLMGFARTQRLILRAEGIQVRAIWMAATTFAGNAISVSLPLVGPGAGTAFTFGRFQRVTGDAATAGWALVVAGFVSSLVWALILAAGAVLSGNGTALVVGLILATVIVVVTVAGPSVLHRPKLRQVTTKGAARVLQRVMQLTKRPAGDPVQHVDQAINRLLALRISLRRSVEVVGFSLVNWLGSVGCLAAAILAVHAPVPWSSLLLVYVAGAAAGSFNLTPGGLGVVEGALAATLVAAGMHSDKAFGSVLIFRLVSFWLVALVGWAIFATVDRPSQRPADRSSQAGDS